MIQIKERNKGIFFIVCAAFCFAGMNLFVKLAGDIPFFEKAFFRNVVALLFASVILFKEKIPLNCANKQIKYVLARATAGTIGIFMNFYAIDRLNIADASMLNKLSPFFAVIFSIFILNEKPLRHQVYCVILAFIGALFILKPNAVNLLSIPALIGLFSGLFAGLAYTFLSKATSNGVPGPFVVFFFSAFSCICCLFPSALHFVTPSKSQLIALFFAGLSAAGGQFSITAAYTHAKASEISVYDYSQILFAGLMGYLFLGELPDGYSFIGYIIIIGASIYMFLKNRQLAK